MPVLFYLLGMVMLIAMIPGFTTFLFLLSSRTKSAKIAKTSIGAFTAVVAVYLIRAITAGYFFFRLAGRVTNIDSVRDAKVGDMLLIRKDLFIYLLVNMVAIFVAKVYVSSILWFV